LLPAVFIYSRQEHYYVWFRKTCDARITYHPAGPVYFV
jgi:hypothetical protein